MGPDRDRNSDAAPPSVPNYPAQPTAAPPAPASSPTPALVIAARESLDAEFRVQSLFELTNSKPTKLAL